MINPANGWLLCVQWLYVCGGLPLEEVLAVGGDEPVLEHVEEVECGQH